MELNQATLPDTVSTSTTHTEPNRVHRKPLPGNAVKATPGSTLVFGKHGLSRSPGNDASPEEAAALLEAHRNGPDQGSTHFPDNDTSHGEATALLETDRNGSDQGLTHSPDGDASPEDAAALLEAYRHGPDQGSTHSPDTDTSPGNTAALLETDHNGSEQGLTHSLDNEAPPEDAAASQETGRNGSGQGPTHSLSNDHLLGHETSPPDTERNGSHESTNGDPHIKQWQPWTFSYWFNAIILFTEVAFIATIIALDRVSATHNGIVTVPEHNGSGQLGTYVKNYYSLLWTSLPSLIFILYGFGWAAIVSDGVALQPYIQLIKGGKAHQTIMLDYSTIPGWKSWIVAGRNKHPHLTWALLLQQLVSIALIPLSSHLLIARPTQSASKVSVELALEYDDTTFDSRTDLQPFIDISTTIHVYNSTPPTWMTDKYAFEPMSLRSSSSANLIATSANLTAEVAAYSAQLDCQTIDPTAYILEEVNQSDNFTIVNLTFTDRKCTVEQALSLQPKTLIYARTWYAICPSSTVNRFGMIAGSYSASSPDKLDHFSITSCISKYWQTNGTLTMAYDSGSKPSFASFTEGKQTLMSSDLEVFEIALPQYSRFDPSATTESDAMGYTVYSTAQRHFSQQWPNASAILQSTQMVYGTVYAALASNVLLQRTSSPRASNGTLTMATNRLFVAAVNAYVILGAIALVIPCHVFLFYYVKTHATMLDEEPYGLLGKAKLLRRSDEVFEVVHSFERQHGRIGEMQEYMKKHYSLGKGDRCWWDSAAKTIRVDGVEEGGGKIQSS